jgi:PD-(D/E)XK endonuclease
VKAEVQRWVVVVLGERVEGLLGSGMEGGAVGGLRGVEPQGLKPCCSVLRNGTAGSRALPENAEGRGLRNIVDETDSIELCAAADPGGLKKKRPGWSKSRVKVTWKRLGEIAEAMFLAKAAELGFGVMKPWGDSEPYDFVLDGHRGRAGLWRVQVKSAHREGAERGYSFRAHGHTLEAYKARDVDALVAYVVPEDAWYVFPIRVFRNRRSVVLYPGSKRKRSKFEEYREGWWRLTEI